MVMSPAQIAPRVSLSSTYVLTTITTTISVIVSHQRRFPSYQVGAVDVACGKRGQVVGDGQRLAKERELEQMLHVRGVGREPSVRAHKVLHAFGGGGKLD
jgi:hypothetical protein